MKEEFERLYLCAYIPDERMLSLENRLLQYREETDPCDNRTAMLRWKEFKQWCGGRYTCSEINRAKKSVAHIDPAKHNQPPTME